MQVEGYTYSVGSEASNQQLSERRATSVRDYLTNAGISAASVTAKGLGETLDFVLSGWDNQRGAENIGSDYTSGDTLRY